MKKEKKHSRREMKGVFALAQSEGGRILLLSLGCHVLPTRIFSDSLSSFLLFLSFYLSTFFFIFCFSSIVFLHLRLHIFLTIPSVFFISCFFSFFSRFSLILFFFLLIFSNLHSMFSFIFSPREDRI